MENPTTAVVGILAALCIAAFGSGLRMSGVVDRRRGLTLAAAGLIGFISCIEFLCRRTVSYSWLLPSLALVFALYVASSRGWVGKLHRRWKSRSLVSVVFVREHSKYGPGDIAGFSRQYAYQLVEARVARLRSWRDRWAYERRANRGRTDAQRATDEAWRTFLRETGEFVSVIDSYRWSGEEMAPKDWRNLEQRHDRARAALEELPPASQLSYRDEIGQLRETIARRESLEDRAMTLARLRDQLRRDSRRLRGI